MILVIAELAFPLLAILAVHRLLFEKYSKKEFRLALKNSVYIVGGITLFFALFPGASDLSSPKDEMLIQQGARDLVGALKEDRAALLRGDALRSLAFVLLTAALLYGWQAKKIKVSLFYVILSLLFLIDLWPVNKRYINEDNFVRKSQVKNPFQPYEADQKIMQDDQLYFRVLDLSGGNPFTNARASFFHKSIGGYHGAKMRRYQELIDHHLAEKANPKILDMLNTKYLIQRGNESNKPTAVKRNSMLGNAWFVSTYRLMENADEEIKTLGEFDPANEALIDKRYEHFLTDNSFKTDTTSNITLTSYAPNRLEYEYSTKQQQIGIFSEIYYPKGWMAEINGKPVDHFRLNYTLRGLVIPAGEGNITFSFKPDCFFTGNKIALAGSILMLLVIIGGIYYYRKTSLKEEDQE